MIAFETALLSILLATLIPVYVALFAATAVSGQQARRHYLGAFSTGVFLWYFSDTIGDSSYLGVNEGLGGGVAHLALAFLFVVGFLSFLAIDRRGESSSDSRMESGGRTYSLLVIPIFLAAALSVHGLGEGVAFGATASSTQSSSIIAAFGGYGPVVSYVLHKVLESTMVASGYVYFISQVGDGSRPHSGDLVLLGAVFFSPVMIGTAVGYYMPLDTTYVYALGAGTSLFVLLKIARRLFGSSWAEFQDNLVKAGLFALLGFVLLYVAALFHSVVLT